MKNIKSLLSASALILGLTALASSHREAPLIANDPLADNTDVYAFRSPDDPNYIIIVANYVPMQLGHGGPNYYSFGQNIRYEIHVDNDVNTPGDDVIYRFTFSQVNEDPSTFFNIRLGLQNLKTTYRVERSTDGGASFMTIKMDGIVPPPNIGPRSISSPVGLNTSYAQLINNSIHQLATGETVFAGSMDDPFFVDLAGIFDLGDAPRQMGTPKDGLACMNVSSIVLKVPISTLQKDGLMVSAASNILDPDFVIGVWASASRRTMRTLNTDGTQDHDGAWVQVSRLGMPLTNEAVIPIGSKDLWNSITPYEDLANIATFGNYFYNPELALYMDDALFGGAVPAFAALRIQRNSLQGFDFGNGQSGLYPLKNTAAVAGTALDDAIYGTLLLPADNSPRSVDLWPIFHTGVPNFPPYQLATGKMGNPLAVGKPFINNFLPNGGDMLRLNMAVTPTDRNSPAFSPLGIVAAAVSGLTDPMYNATAALQWIPNMDGFPNGRRLEDDVTRIELQAVGGVALAAIGLFYDDYTAGDPNPVTQDLIDVLTYSTGVDANDRAFGASFPYLAPPNSGTGLCGGLEVAYTQPDILNPSELLCEFGAYGMGAWGARPRGGNRGTYLHASFTAAFPNGLEVGCTNKLRLTTAQAVTNFLPSGGPAAMLPAGTLTNPGNYNNVLVGQLVAATLNVGFDVYDPAFSPAITQLRNAYITTGIFAGWQVSELLTAANAFVGGCPSTYTAGQLNTALTAVNEYSANVSTPYLSCTVVPKSLAIQGTESDKITAYPNPASDVLYVNSSFASEGAVTMDLYDVSGRVVATVARFTSEAGVLTTRSVDVGQLPGGLYLLRIQQGETINSRRIIINR